MKPAVGRYPKVISDADLDEARKLFDLDLWSYAAVTGFPSSPVASKGGMVVNRTAITSVVPFLFSDPYNASKAATSILSGTMCLELGSLNAQAADVKS
jgi:1-acylglycerone phosphate reductase